MLLIPLFGLAHASHSRKVGTVTPFLYESFYIAYASHLMRFQYSFYCMNVPSSHCCNLPLFVQRYNQRFDRADWRCEKSLVAPTLRLYQGCISATPGNFLSHDILFLRSYDAKAVSSAVHGLLNCSSADCSAFDCIKSIRMIGGDAILSYYKVLHSVSWSSWFEMSRSYNNNIGDDEKIRRFMHHETM